MSVGFNASAFRSKLQFGGARPNLYEVVVSFPSDISNEAVEEFTFMCRSTSLPGLQIGTAQVFYFGRPVKFAGDRVFDDWAVRVINDEDFIVRNAFEAWQNRLAMLDHNTPAITNAAAVGGESQLYCDIRITQLAKDGQSELKRYYLKNAMPMSIGPLELAYDANDQIEEFDVQFTYDYFVTEEIDGIRVSS
jgi:hypothetical protein